MDSVPNYKSKHYHKNKRRGENGNTNKCYTCNPRGTVKEHIISETDNFVFNHDMFRRPMIILTSKLHYHSILEIPDEIKLQLFRDIDTFVNFWNLTNGYQLIINNGDLQSHHHFHIKIKINESICNRMRRDHFNRINLNKSYEN
jgi:hypothetical protein